jgi:ABC-type enterochelin transport system permease subunit
MSVPRTIGWIIATSAAMWVAGAIFQLLLYGAVIQPCCQ